MFNLILLGDPASGKATQAKKLCKKYKLYNFDMGEQLRLLRQKNKKINRELIKTKDQGKLTPTAIVRAILKKHIQSAPKQQGILFNGHPKMVGEAKIVHRLLNQTGRKDSEVLVLYVHIPKKEVIKRMLGRKRADDNIKALANRIKYYHLNIAEVIKFFKSKYQFADLNGLGTVPEVNKRIEKKIHEFIVEKSRRN